MKEPVGTDPGKVFEIKGLAGVGTQMPNGIRDKRPSKQVARLLVRMKGEMTVLEMMAALKLGGRRNFLERYLTPAIDAGWVERTEPDSPHSPTQRYRLTAKGKGVRGEKTR